MPFVEATVLSDDRLQDLLLKSSRTFALAIPQLPEVTRREVTIAYLLFRIADTFEDASGRWDKTKQLEALSQFEGVLERRSQDEIGAMAEHWLKYPPTDVRGYLELLAAAPAVVASWLSLSAAAIATIGGHTCRTAHLMARFVERSDDRGVLQLEGMRELREYCYAVAGIVGELLTELFLLGCPKLASVGSELRQRAGAFGEGLQLVNILKDSAGDAIEGRNYLPLGVDRGEVFEIARRDLEQAVAYCLTIQKAGAPDGIVAFTALPVELAWATLDRVERHGPGSKIPRHLVFQLHRRVEQAIAEGRPVLSSKLSDQEGD